MPEKLHVTLFENPTAWPLPDDANATQKSLDFCLLKSYVRHLGYYTARVSDVHPVEGTRTWQGRCPFCEGPLRIDALSGWSNCLVCGYQGDAYTLEFLLFGDHAPERWDDCVRQAEALMGGPLAQVLESAYSADTALSPLAS